MTVRWPFNGGICALVFLLCGSEVQAAEQNKVLISKPVPLDSQKSQTDEKGQLISQTPYFFSVFLGSQMLLADSVGADAAKTFASDNILRTSETIYRGSRATLSDASAPVTFSPAVRFEWEIPFERANFLPSWRIFSLLLSFEGAYSPEKSLLASSGNFRYQNAQAQHIALTDVTYTGTLTATEKHYALAPMLGFGLTLSNASMQRWGGLSVLLRFAGGVALQSGQRNYELALNPQYISAGTYSDTYVIKGSFTQAYSMAVLAAGRAELGFRFRLSERLYFTVTAAANFYYGFLPYDNYGVFAEQAGQNKNIFQKVVSGTGDQDYLGIVPAFFLALSTAI